MEIISALAVGTFYFWIFLFVFVFILSSLVENEHGGWATITFIGTTAVLHFTNIINIGLLFQNPIMLGVYFLLYVIAGIVWSMTKWYYYCKEWAEERKTHFYKYHTNATVEEYNKHMEDIWPAAKFHKAKIIKWMTFWPFSFVGTILNFRLFFKKVYVMVGSMFENISNSLKKQYIKK